MRLLTACLVTFFSGATVAAQAPRALTAADYEQAEKFMAYNANPLVFHTGVRPTWLPDGRFWYRVMTERGPEFVLVDPKTGAKTPCDLSRIRQRTIHGPKAMGLLRAQSARRRASGRIRIERTAE